MKKERRWLKSILAASTDAAVAMPWQRGQRRRPEGTKVDLRPMLKPRAMAAR